MQEKKYHCKKCAIVSELIAECGGPKGTPKKIIFNGIFSGDAISDDSVAILANTCSITIINEENISKKDRNECMRCGRCVRVCPINLIPALLMKYAKKGMTDKARELNIEECIECGLCAYDCPSRIPILEYIRIAKKEAKTEVN
jgi:electron transport complex protein RnfC